MLSERDGELVIEQEVRPRANGHTICSGCGARAPGYDRLRARRFDLVPGVVYQLDAGVKRLLWVAKERTEATIRQFSVGSGWCP